MSPIMETLTGIMIAILIFYSGKLIMNGQLNINNFFSFLAAMMLAYQPVKTLTKVNVAIGQGLAAAKRIIPIIDTKNEIIESGIPTKIEIETKIHIVIIAVTLALKGIHLPSRKFLTCSPKYLF